MTLPSNPTSKSPGTSPAASGPAGALFEGQVGAHYLLTMLAEADPRGLPGLLIERVELQRAGEGHPLDDVIVRGVTQDGEPAVLEVQVKRTITFSPGDAVFKDVVAQLARAFAALDLSHQRHQFAVATERTSFKITGPYQDVLRWSREVSSAGVFFGRISGPGVGNDDMRNFVSTVRTHLGDTGFTSDDETVWQVLRRFQILTFDYDAPGSQSQELAEERTKSVLDRADATRASALWKVLIEIAIRTAASGGDLDRTVLLAGLASVDRFQILGSRRNRAPRETLAESARLAADDLRRTIAGVSLARTAQLQAVREALDHGRYVEILGGPGVGKSGLLGMLVDQVLTEGRAIVLTPERTPSGGWLGFKSALQIEGGPEAFLSDLAIDGGAILFVDSLDFFDDPGKRATVSDLARAAASVPAFQVIITARTDFDRDEPNWLPASTLAKLGPTPTVVIDELGDGEVNELRAGAPMLRALLADDHPARSVARNLFRLSRLLEVEGPADKLRSEVDLLERWWSTADGPQPDRRNRGRLLADLTDAILEGNVSLATRTSAPVVDALIGSGTLRELGPDELVFRHDVLREWGVAARLHEAPGKIDRLPLTRAAPPALVRGVELGARFALERSVDGHAWLVYLNRFSHDVCHASWRRWSLLSILRSEIAFELLDRAFASLMENDGALLRELIRTTIAVESRPLTETFAGLVVEGATIPTSLYGPNNLSWGRLARWLLARQGDLPLHALPDIVELFQSLSASMFFRDPITPAMASALVGWLEEIEDAEEHHPLAPGAPRFAIAFKFEGLSKLAADVRVTFLLMAFRVPERAQSYLRHLLGRRNPDYKIREIMKLRGSLAEAAPVELVELTLAGLIPKEDGGRHRRHTTRNEAFSHLDSIFLPTSPAQGPFLELLNAAPEHGLGLIRRLTSHAIAYQSDGAEPGDDGLTLAFPSGPRFFPWVRTYHWSRQTEGFYAVESALLALEAWAHARMERGEPTEDVIADVLGPDGSPAAFLLIAVDVLISHWPKTWADAIPFLGSPELLSLDRSRQAYDQVPAMDLDGWGAIGPKEPAGGASMADLKKRLSRRYSLEGLLGSFAIDNLGDISVLRELLAGTATRLGLPEPGDTFAEPRFMARYALNLIDPANWPLVDGGRGYVSPLDEALHIENLQKKSSAQMMDAGLDSAIQIVLEDSARSSAELAKQAVAYAQRVSTQSEAPEEILLSRTNTILGAAMILARDGDDPLLDQHEGWARSVLEQTFASDIRISGTGEQLRFNPLAIGALGYIHLWHRRGLVRDRNALLEIAGRDTAYAAPGFGAGLHLIRKADARLVPALLRCALVAQIQHSHEWDDVEEYKSAIRAQHRQRVASAIQAEVAWLDGAGSEPAWPLLPRREISIVRGVRIGGPKGDLNTAKVPREKDKLRSQSAASWLRQLTLDAGVFDLGWVTTFVNTYANWTAAANGAGLEPDLQIENQTCEWDSVFFSLVALAFTRMKSDEATAHVGHLIAVPDESFFDIASELLPAIDRVYFNDLGLDLDTALRLRTAFADRLIETAGWLRARNSNELAIEMRLGPAIAALFFNRHSPWGGASSYLLEPGIDQVDPFLPNLARLIEDGPVPFCGILVMNLIEVSPQPRHLDFLLSSARTWLKRQSTNTQLWVDHGLGARVARWLEEVLGVDPSLGSTAHPLRSQIDDVLARLVQLGVPQARRVEMLLAGET